MTMNPFCVKYVFRLPNRSHVHFDIVLDPVTLELQGNTREVKPSWTDLGFHQCPNCPLTPDLHPSCPLALGIANLVEKYDGFLSHDTVELEVVTGERRVTQTTSVQRGVSSLMGLVIATCGCPHATFLRPMARYHLPLSSMEETVYRATSMYLLAQYFIGKEGGAADPDLDGLRHRYSEMGIMNMAVADRIRAATKTDSSVNAIIVLDVFAKMVEIEIDESLSRIRSLFQPYLAADGIGDG